MEKQYNKIISFLKEFQEKNNINGYVLGISGGKDSTVVAKLLCDAIGKENVLGVLMPNGKQSDISDSREVIKLLGIRSMEVNISDSYWDIIDTIEDVGYDANDDSSDIKISEKAKSNIAPRIRMIVLYAIAQSLGYVVAGTGNLSERFVGWFTKWGDGACDINPIACLTCTKVIALGDYLGLPEHLVHKVPADGITGKSDEENLGISYHDLDLYINGGDLGVSQEVGNKIDLLHKAAYHKFAPLIIEDSCV